MPHGRVKFYGFQKNGELVREPDGGYTFYRTYDEAEANLSRGERIAHVSLRWIVPKEGK